MYGYMRLALMPGTAQPQGRQQGLDQFTLNRISLCRNEGRQNKEPLKFTAFELSDAKHAVFGLYPGDGSWIQTD
jgi:hypothetical protein